MTNNTLPTFTFSDLYNIAPLPLHLMDTTTHTCTFCGEAPIWDTYEEYVDYFYRAEWEGDRHHAPDEREVWEAFSSTCIA